MRFLLLAVGIFLLTTTTVACQSTATPNPTSTPYPTYTPPPTYTPYPTYTPQPTIERISAVEREQLVWPTGPRDDVIPFSDAADFMGETVTVEGTIIDTYDTGSVTFLNFSPNRADFKAVIFADDRAKFPSPPETLLFGKLVRVQGLIEEYQGGPEIIINSPAQIEVALTLGQAIPTDCNCPAPEPCPTQIIATAPLLTVTDIVSLPQKTTATEQSAIDWQEAAAYAGQAVTVKGQVSNTYNSGKVIFLNFDPDYRNTFKVVIFPDAWPLFPTSPDEYYQNQQIAVTGQIEMYQGAPEIIVNHPDQIRILE